MARARKGTATQTKLGFLIYGVQGTWKSSMCLEFAKFKREDGKPFRVLYIDCEFGSIDDYIDNLAGDGVDPDNIYIVYTQSLGEVRDYIRKATVGEDFFELDDDGTETDVVVTDADGEPFRPDAIVVDGASVLYIATQQGLTEFSKKRAMVRAKKNELSGIERTVAIESSGLEIKDYSTLTFKGQDFILDLNASGKHWAITAREVDEKETVKSSNGEQSFQRVATGKKLPEGFKNLQYNAKCVLRMIMTDEGEVKALVENKDRSGVHPQNVLLDEPTLMDWSVVIERNINRKEFKLANGLGESVRIEQKIYEQEILDLDTETPSESKGSTTGEKSVEQYQEEIAKAIKGMDAAIKKTLQSRLKDAGLPTKYSTVTDTDTLEQILEIITK